MSYELFIALRYLRAKRRQTAVSVITAIAVAGITLGVAALIIAQALITGFRLDVQDKILRGTAHLNLLREDNSGIENYRELLQRIRQVPGVKSASATLYAPVLLGLGDRQEQAILKAVDLAAEPEARELSATLVEGDGRMESGSAAEPGLVVGKQLARLLGLRLDDSVTAISAVARLTPAGLQQRPRYTAFRVTGIFSSGLYEYDSKWAYVSLASAQQLGGGGDTAGVLQISVSDIYAVSELGNQVRGLAGKGFTTTNWQELNRPLFAALQLQHRMILVFFSLLVAIAALNIITTLTMTVIEKHRDIAILRAQGSTPPAIRRIFMFQGLIVGLVGAGAGLALGLALSWLANHFQLISLPAEIYSVSHITLQVRPRDCLAVAVLAIGICLLATLYPSRMAARLTPVEGLRYE
jgi:lipoprotein-releasing system permease protein